ncbi:MAG: SGNH/GDSL hydrolase family protein [Phycisphaerales bacterium]|nr:SGNH/GDSL hydrolase family protein [Phycisphaerales bacterium]
MAAIRISLYGDSMTEYLHRPPRALAQALANEAPGREFELFNYGIGATRAELVLYRLRYEYWYGRERMAPLNILKPDVLVLESCAFNNSSDQQAGLDNFIRIWDEIIADCRELAPKALLLACLTIPSSPHKPDERANRLFYHAGAEIFALRHHWRVVYQQAFADWAVHRSLPLVDLRRKVHEYEAQGVPRSHWIAADGVHPNAMGVELISTQIAREVVRLSPGEAL